MHVLAGLPRRAVRLSKPRKEEWSPILACVTFRLAALVCPMAGRGLVIGRGRNAAVHHRAVGVVVDDRAGGPPWKAGGAIASHEDPPLRWRSSSR